MTTLGACDNSPKLETCQFIEIEDAEFEVDAGDVDIERGEVEMVCGDKIIDVTWGQFRQKIQIDPGQYKGNLDAFKRQVTCMKDERSKKKEVLCSGPGSGNDFVPLSFSYDD
ncbi:MAG: hypothetical protein F6K14_21340 [Symploca sp. SIO2C1]|nr:hypothetical protein [Symploca sp. SIO2C1]